MKVLYCNPCFWEYRLPFYVELNQLFKGNFHILYATRYFMSKHRKLLDEINTKKDMLIYVTNDDKNCPLCDNANNIINFYERAYGLEFYVFDRSDTSTLAGTLCYPAADSFIVEWEEMKKVYPKAVNLGSIF